MKTLTMLLALALPSLAGTVVTPEEQAAGWTLLFDGASLKGWRPYGKPAGTPIGEETIHIAVPDFDDDQCDACDKCVEFCQFNALASVGKTPLLFPELCHGCGGCMLVCPQDAIREKDYRIGVIKTARAGSITLKSGCLDVGVSLASTLVHALKERLEDGVTTILDAPPGTACQAVATLRGSDFVVLVTEPTPFGLHDLTLASRFCHQVCVLQQGRVQAHGQPAQVLDDTLLRQVFGLQALRLQQLDTDCIVPWEVLT